MVPDSGGVGSTSPGSIQLQMSEINSLARSAYYDPRGTELNSITRYLRRICIAGAAYMVRIHRLPVDFVSPVD